MEEQIENELIHELRKRNHRYRNKAFTFECFAGDKYLSLLARPASVAVGRASYEFTGEWSVYDWDSHTEWKFSPLLPE